MIRDRYLDNLRTFAVFLGILCAAVNGYSLTAIPIYVTNGPVPAVTMLYEWSTAVALPVLFFLSGYLSAKDLRIHLIRPYLKKRWNRLGWPWLFGSLILAPELAYINYVDGGGMLSFIDFYVNHFWFDAFTQGPFWFLGLLLLFTAILALCKKCRKNILQQHKVSGSPHPTICLFIAAQILLTAYAMSIDGLHWTSIAYVITFQPARLVSCALYFALGVLAFKHRWLMPSGYMPSRHWTMALFLLTLVYIVGEPVAQFLCYLFKEIPASATLVTAASLLSMPAILGLLAFFRNLKVQDSPRALLLANLSYPLYFLSDTLIQNTAFFLKPMEWNGFVTVIVTIILSAIYSYLLCTYALWHLPCFKKHR